MTSDQVNDVLGVLDDNEPKPDKPRPRIVCLCGSGRFRDAFEQAEYNETLAGKIVLTIGCNTHDVARSAELCQHKAMLDELHLRKIELADEVLVLNVGGYVGESTSREIAHARKLNKPIRWLADPLAGKEISVTVGIDVRTGKGIPGSASVKIDGQVLP